MALTNKMNDELVEDVISQNPQAVMDYQTNTFMHRKIPARNALGYLRGQAMRMSEGMADDLIITDLLKDKLK